MLHGLGLNGCTIHTIFPIQELNDISHRIPDCAIIAATELRLGSYGDENRQPHECLVVGSRQTCDRLNSVTVHLHQQTLLVYVSRHTICLLNELLDAVAQGPAYMTGRDSLDHEVLHGLDQPPLDVPSTGCLDSSVNQPLTTSHGVKEEFLHQYMHTPEIHTWKSSKQTTIAVEVGSSKTLL